MAVRLEYEATLGHWGFIRGSEQIVMERLEPLRLRIAFNGVPAQFMDFATQTDVLMFHCNLETELQRDGWTLAFFESRTMSELSRSARGFLR